MKKIRKCTAYIDAIIKDNKHPFWRDEQFIAWMSAYLRSSFATSTGYIHYEGNIKCCTLWYDRIQVIDDTSTLIASVSVKNFKKYVRRITQYETYW